MLKMENDPEKDTAFLKVEIDLQMYKIVGYFAGSDELIDRQMALDSKKNIKKWLIGVGKKVEHTFNSTLQFTSFSVLFYDEQPESEIESEWQNWFNLPELHNEYEEQLKDEGIRFTEFKILRRALLEIEVLIR